MDLQQPESSTRPIEGKETTTTLAGSSDPLFSSMNSLQKSTDTLDRDSKQNGDSFFKEPPKFSAGESLSASDELDETPLDTLQNFLATFPFPSDPKHDPSTHALNEKLHTHLTSLKRQYVDVAALVDPYFKLENLESASYISVTILTTWFITYFRFSFGWLVVVLLAMAAVYRRAHFRLKRKMKKELELLLAMQKLDTDAETVEWLNLFLSRFWKIYEQNLSQSIKDTVDTVLESSKPAFLEDLRLTTFTLGSQAPRVDSIRTYPGTEEDVLMMDWGLSFTPVDEEDLSGRERRLGDVKNFLIQLTARVGAGVASIPLPILLKELEFEGNLRVKIKFMTEFPHIKSLEIGFMEIPTVDFILRPLKGMDLNDMPGLSTFLKDAIESGLQTAVVNPNKILLDVEAMMGNQDLADKPVGVLRVHLFDARALKNIDLAGTIDPCVVLYIGEKEVGRSRTINNTLNPAWNEVFHIIVTNAQMSHLSNKSDNFRIEVIHNNPVKRRVIGSTKGLRLHRWIKLRDPEEPVTELEPGTEKDPLRPLTRDEHDDLVGDWGTPFHENSDVWKSLYGEDKHKKLNGSIRIDLAYFPIPDMSTAEDAATGTASNPDLLSLQDLPSGIVTIGVHQAKELACSKSANPEVAVELNSTFLFKTHPRKRTNNPIWDVKRTFFIEDVESTVLRFLVTDKGLSTTSIGEVKVSLKSALAKSSHDDWYTLFGTSSGKIRLTFKFTPVDVEGALETISHSKRKEPIGILRINLREAKSLANVEMLRKSDPYVKLGLASRPIGATNVRENTLDPRWNEIFFAVLYTRREKLFFQVLDWNNLQKDKKLGEVELPVSLILPAPISSSAILEDSGENAEDKPRVNGTLPPEPLQRTKTEENATTRFEEDGLRITRKPGTESADVWAPLYRKMEEESESKSPSRENLNQKPSEKKLRLAATGESLMKAVSTIGNELKRTKIRQKGHLHFELEFFPVVQESVIRAHKDKITSRPGGRASVTFAGDVSNLADGSRRSVTNPAVERKSTVTKPGEEKVVEKVGTEEVAAPIIGADGASTVNDSTKVEPAQDPLGGNVPMTSEMIRAIVDTNPSGILRLRIVDAQISRSAKTYVELALDGDTIFRTRATQATTNPRWGESLDKFLPDIASAEFVFYIREQIDKAPSRNDFILAQWRGDLVSAAMGKADLSLPLHDFSQTETNLNALPKVGSFKISLGFSPVKLDEVMTEKHNTGILHIDIISGSDLTAVDSSGTSDPYCVVNLNGNRIHKTKAIKKDLNPAFNETLSTAIYSRLRSTIEIQIMDHNNFSSHQTLGRLVIPVSRIPPGEVINADYPLEEAKSGTLKLRLYYDPQKLEKKNPNSLDTEARLLGEDTRINKFTRGLTSQIGSNLGFSTLMGAIKDKDNKDPNAGSSSRFSFIRSESVKSEKFKALTGEENASDTTSFYSKQGSAGPSLANSRENLLDIIQETGGFTGDVTIRILGARGLKAADANGLSDPYVKVTQKSVAGKVKTLYKTAVIKKTLAPEWQNESVVVFCPPSKVQLVVKDYNTFRSSVELGSLELDLSTLGQDPCDRWFPLSSESNSDVSRGEIHLLLVFSRSSNSSPTNGPLPKSFLSRSDSVKSQKSRA